MHSFFFQASFSIAAATIVSGAMAGRTKYASYFTGTVIMTGFIYPVIVHWIWSENGWLSVANPSPFMGSGVIDFAGSGVVHLCGGVAAIVGAKLVGPRIGRFRRGRSVPIEGHSFVLSTMGSILLWFGWFGFNAGSTLGLSGGKFRMAGLAAVNTLLASTAAGLGAMGLSLQQHKKVRLGQFVNCILGGLVSITAGCASVEPWAAALIGFVSPLFFTAGIFIEERLEIDDPVDAFPVHAMCGFWGLLGPGLLGSKSIIEESVGRASDFGVIMGGSGDLLLNQMVAVLAIGAWSGMFALIMFFVMKQTIGLRVDKRMERIGLNLEHDFTPQELQEQVFEHFEESLKAAKRGNVSSRRKSARRHKSNARNSGTWADKPTSRSSGAWTDEQLSNAQTFEPSNDDATPMKSVRSRSSSSAETEDDIMEYLRHMQSD
eukprot:TRINITY_DN1982_c0_g1_i1.p1 TRINITY_DN1982_c0_g1~~TRINITY_DN1982_c0_g1_i1.p1  ORF type:complete len:432 (+),score=111.73 TRINITY_DN1982_c0_g1_i1:454-1749(+)